MIQANDFNIAFLLVACVGLHWILKYGTILNPIRRVITKVKIFKELLKCSLCLGFWCGAVIGLLYSDPVLLALASSGTCWFADNINNVLQSIEIKLDKSE